MQERKTDKTILTMSDKITTKKEQTVTIIDDDVANAAKIDPLIQPLIDSEELKTNNDADDEELHHLDKISSSILVLATSSKQNRVTSISEVARRCTGIFYAFIGSSLFTCSGFIIKQLRVDFFDALLCRFILQTLILTIFIVYKRYRLLNGSISLIILQFVRALLAVSGLILFYMSYRYIPLPDLTTVRYTQVVWTTLMAMIVFRERISIPNVIAIVLTLVGVVCVAQPTFIFPIRPSPSSITTNKTETIPNDLESDKSHRSLGLCLSLACAFSISASIVLNKKLLGQKIHQSIVMFQFSTLTLCLLIVNQVRNRFILHMYDTRSMFTWQFGIAAFVSLFQVLSSTITQKAIKLEHPSIVTVVQSSDILFAIVLQNLIANEKSNWLVLIGSALVTTSIFLVGIHKLWQDRKIILAQNSDTTICS